MAGPSGNRALIRFVGLTAATLGIVQGLTYTIFAVLCILIYFKVIQTTPNTSVQSAIYNIYLYKSDFKDTNKLVTPFVFNIFMYFYLVLSLTWFLISSVLWQKMFRRKWKNAPYIMGSWSLVTLIISILDVILMSMIAHDLDYILGVSGDSDSALSTGVAVVMTVAAKGYILWIVNVFYACLSLKYARSVHMEPQRTASIIDAYATSQRPWELADNATLYDEANAANFEFTNKSYTDDYGIPVFSSRSQSFQHLHINDQNQTNLNPLSNTNTNSLNNDVMRKNARNTDENNLYQTPLDHDQFIFGPPATEIPRVHPNPDYDPENQGPPVPNRTAKIGKQGPQGQDRRTPPMNVPPPRVGNGNNRGPYIPEPDYTPPGSPKVKSVLRPKSNYVL